MAPDLDNVDRGILHLLQVDARNTTAREIANRIGVSPSTVRNRIEDLEADGVIRGYYPQIDYEAADLPLQVLFVITAPPAERSASVEDLLEIKGVVDVRETLTGRRNLYVEAVGASTSEITRMTDAIHELGLEIDHSDIMKQHRSQPFDQFHYEGDLFDEEREEG